MMFLCNVICVKFSKKIKIELDKKGVSSCAQLLARLTVAGRRHRAHEVRRSRLRLAKRAFSDGIGHRQFVDRADSTSACERRVFISRPRSQRQTEEKFARSKPARLFTAEAYLQRR